MEMYDYEQPEARSPTQSSMTVQREGANPRIDIAWRLTKSATARTRRFRRQTSASTECATPANSMRQTVSPSKYTARQRRLRVRPPKRHRRCTSLDRSANPVRNCPARDCYHRDGEKLFLTRRLHDTPSRNSSTHEIQQLMRESRERLRERSRPARVFRNRSPPLFVSLVGLFATGGFMARPYACNPKRGISVTFGHETVMFGSVGKCDG
jgi:hypothetical protein